MKNEMNDETNLLQHGISFEKIGPMKFHWKYGLKFYLIKSEFFLEEGVSKEEGNDDENLSEEGIKSISFERD